MEEKNRREPASGFTLVELLVVISIIALLISLLLPTLGLVRQRAARVSCASNVRQLSIALIAYASDSGRFPPNFTPPDTSMQAWYDVERIGRYIRGAPPPSSTPPTMVVGGVMVCPNDDRALRSYAMNIWASGILDDSVVSSVPQRGTQWGFTTKDSTRLMLVTEAWSYTAYQGSYVASATVGYRGLTPGQRFGAGGGIAPPFTAGRWGKLNCELPFVRHREKRGSATAAVGVINVGFGDGHVESRSTDDMCYGAHGTSTLNSLWSPYDVAINF